jgi:hypothetical protein
VAATKLLAIMLALQAFCGVRVPDDVVMANHFHRVNILVTLAPAASSGDLFLMVAKVEDAVGRRLILSSEPDVEEMKNIEA